MAYKLGKLYIHDHRHSLTSGEILIQPSDDDYSADLFVIIEIDGNKPENLSIIQQLFSLIFEIYEASQIHQAEKILENILQNLNTNLLEIAPKGFNFSKNFHCFIGILQEKEFYFTILGKIKTYLIKGSLMNDIAGRAPLFNKTKPFDSVISGSLGDNDRILITTENLTNYISLEKIKKIGSTLPASSAIVHFNNILQSAPPSASFFSILLQLTPKPEIKISPETNTGIIKSAGEIKSQNSISQLLKNQAETEKILKSPSVFQSLKEKISETAQIYSQKKQTTDKKSKKLIPKIKTRTISPPFKKIIQWLTTVIDKNKREHLLKQTGAFLNKALLKFNKLSKFHKILFGLTLLVVLIFSQGLIWQEKIVERRQQQAAYDESITLIAEKKSAVEASLIYNDYQRAKQLLLEINAIIANLPAVTEDEKNKNNEIAKSIEDLFNQTWKIIKVPEPVSLFNFREINLTAEISHLGYKDGFIYAFNNTNQIFNVNVNSGEAVILDQFNVIAGDATLFERKNSLIINSPDNKFYAITSDEISNIDANLPAEIVKIDDLNFYLDKMYLLDKTSSQIFRLTNYGNSFASPTAWLKENLPLNQAVDITVDGSIYVLQSDGQIIKFVAGLQQDFPEIIIEPAITSPLKIYTTENSDKLYILDPGQKRLVILNKQGELIRQYISEQFNNLKDFIILENENKALLLNGAQVFVISLQ